MRTRTPQQAEKILNAAAQLFATHRFHEARMEDIASLAEVGKGTLYRYFDDKEELYLALLERAATGLTSRLAEQVERTQAPREQLEAFTGALLGYFCENPYLLDLIQHAEAMQRSGQHFPWQKARNEAMALVRSIFAEGAARGDFEIEDPELAALMLLGGLRGFLRFGTSPGDPDIPRRVVAGLLTGFARHGGAPPFQGAHCTWPETPIGTEV